MDAPVDDEIAHHTEKDQHIHSGVKERRRQQISRKTPKPRGGKRTGRYQDEAAMELRLFSPINCQGKRDAEGEHVEQWNDEKAFRVGGSLADVETRHGDSGGNTYERDGNTEGRAKPAGLAMQAHVVGADQ